MVRHDVVCGHFCGLQLTTDPHDWRSGVSGYPQWVRLINKWSPHHDPIVTCIVTRLTDYWYAIENTLDILGVVRSPFVYNYNVYVWSEASPSSCLPFLRTCYCYSTISTRLSFSSRLSNQSLTKHLDQDFWSSSKKNQRGRGLASLPDD